MEYLSGCLEFSDQNWEADALTDRGMIKSDAKSLTDCLDKTVSIMRIARTTITVRTTAGPVWMHDYRWLLKSICLFDMLTKSSGPSFLQNELKELLGTIRVSRRAEHGVPSILKYLMTYPKTLLTARLVGI